MINKTPNNNLSLNKTHNKIIKYPYNNNKSSNSKQIWEGKSNKRD